MPDAAAFAAIEVPALLVEAADSPPEQRDMTEKMAEALPNARLVRIGGGHLIDPAGAEVLVVIKEVLGERIATGCARARTGVAAGRDI